MRDVVVSTRPLSYRSAGSIRSLPTTCTHEARRGRGSYTTGREILSPLHPPTSLSLTRPLSLSVSLSLFLFLSGTSSFFNQLSHPTAAKSRKDEVVFHPRCGETATSKRQSSSPPCYSSTPRNESHRVLDSPFSRIVLAITLGIRGPTREKLWMEISKRR